MFDPTLLEMPLINRLHDILGKDGFVSEESLRLLAEETGRPLAELHGFVSFFDSIRTRKPGKNQVAVCYGTPCYARGAELVYNRFRAELSEDSEGTFDDGLISLEKVQCVGACSMAPVVSFNGKLEKVRPNQVAPRLEKLREQSTPG